MKVTTERLENCIVNLAIEIEEQETEKYMRSAARALSGKYRVPGFRPGKAPYNAVVRQFGIDGIRHQVVDQFGDDIFKQGLEQSRLEPVDQSNLVNVTWEPLTFHVQVPVGPLVELGDYRSMRIPLNEPVITDEALQEAIERLRHERGEWQDADRGAELGDQVVLDISGTIEDRVVLGNTAREMILNAESPYPVPGFAQQVAGMTAGEQREFDLPFPPDHYNPDTAGKMAHWQVSLHQIRTEKLPPLDDDFAVLVGDYENLADLETKLRQKLLQDAQKQARDDYLEQIWDHLFATAHIEYPKIYVDQEIEMFEQDLENNLKSRNISLEDFFKLTNTTQEAWRERIRPQAETRLKQRLILSQVIAQEQIQISESDILDQIEKLVEPLGEQADSVRSRLTTPNGMVMISMDMANDAAVERLIAIARGEAPELPPAEADTGVDAKAEAGAEADVSEGTGDVEPTAEPTLEGEE